MDSESPSSSIKVLHLIKRMLHCEIIVNNKRLLQTQICENPVIDVSYWDHLEPLSEELCMDTRVHLPNARGFNTVM